MTDDRWFTGFQTVDTMRLCAKNTRKTEMSLFWPPINVTIQRWTRELVTLWVDRVSQRPRRSNRSGLVHGILFITWSSMFHIFCLWNPYSSIRVPPKTFLWFAWINLLFIGFTTFTKSMAYYHSLVLNSSDHGHCRMVIFAHSWPFTTYSDPFDHPFHWIFHDILC